MFSRTIKLFDPQAAPTAAGTAGLYTTPNAVRTRIAKVSAVNTNTTTVREVTAYLVESGGAVGTDNEILVSYSVGPNQSVTLADLIGHVLEEGDALYVTVDAGSDLILHATGTEVTV